MAALFAVAGGVLSGRIGPRAVGAVGGAALRAWAACGGRPTSGVTEHYASDYLPGMLIGGAGVGLVNPALAGAATAQLPPTRLATGSAVLTMSRQLGSALGVALLVAVLGTPSPAGVVDAFDDAWWMMVAAAFGSAAAFTFVGSLKAHAGSVEEEITTGVLA